MSIVAYGIPNCDTVRKARAWLTDAEVPHTFHDYKRAGVDPARLQRWAAMVGWDHLVNRAGPTFRKLPDADRIDLDETRAIALMTAHPSMIRRPVVEHAGGLLVGFDPATWNVLITTG